MFFIKREIRVINIEDAFIGLNGFRIGNYFIGVREAYRNGRQMISPRPVFEKVESITDEVVTVVEYDRANAHNSQA